MPAGIIPNEGLSEQVLESLGQVAPGALPWRLILWTNDIVPDANTVLADLDVATWDGFTEVDLSRDLWQPPDIMSACAHVQWDVTPIVWFVIGGPLETNFGVAYYDQNTNHLRFVQRFDDDDIEPVVIGGKVSLLPKYTLNSSEC